MHDYQKYMRRAGFAFQVAGGCLPGLPAQAASFEINDGEVETTPQTLGAGETGVIAAGGALNTAATAITVKEAGTTPV